MHIIIHARVVHHETYVGPLKLLSFFVLSASAAYVPHLKEKIDFFLFHKISKCGVGNSDSKSFCESAID